MQVPQLGDDDDRAWVFDSVPKKQLVHRLFTAMNGSVTAVGGKTDGATNTRKRKASGNAPKAKAKARRTPAGSAAQGAGANEPDVNIPSDPRLNVTTIDCQYGVRNKLWLDDLMQCASHTVSSLQSQFGNFLDAETLDKTKVGIIRLGLRFAFCGDVTVTTKKGTKKYSKWSLLRPALQAHGVYLVTQADQSLKLNHSWIHNWCEVCLCHESSGWYVILVMMNDDDSDWWWWCWWCWWWWYWWWWFWWMHDEWWMSDDGWMMMIYGDDSMIMMMLMCLLGRYSVYILFTRPCLDNLTHWHVNMWTMLGMSGRSK